MSKDYRYVFLGSGLISGAILGVSLTLGISMLSAKGCNPFGLSAPFQVAAAADEQAGYEGLPDSLKKEQPDNELFRKTRILNTQERWAAAERTLANPDVAMFLNHAGKGEKVTFSTDQVPYAMSPFGSVAISTDKSTEAFALCLQGNDGH